MAREQRKLAAIVAADVVGYSRLMGRDESGTLARLRRNRSEYLDPVLTKYGGRLVKLTGDGALAERLRVLRAQGASPKYHHPLVGGVQVDAVDPAERVDRRLHHATHRLVDPELDGHCNCATAGRADRLRHRLGALLAARGHDDVRAFGGQSRAGGCTEPPSAAEHQHGLARQPSHVAR